MATRSLSPPLSKSKLSRKAPRSQKSAHRRQLAKDVGVGVGVAAIYAGVGYGYYRMYTTSSQREFNRARMRSWVQNPTVPHSMKIAGVHARGQARKLGIVYRSHTSNQAKFNRYYNRRQRSDRRAMLRSANRMARSNTGYKQYSKGKFGNMYNGPTSKAGRVRRDYKGRFAGWF